MADRVLIIRGLTKSFGDFKVVDGLDLEVEAGEMVALLGPSGCGKTTTLRMIAGLTRPSSGEIEFGGTLFVSMARRIHLPPEKRNIGMVFQSYGLWPHMTVAENVGYPLKLRGMDAAESRRKVVEVLELMGLERLVDQTIPKLSGGQQQRVALARALVYRPSLILFDEPFSNLDAALRGQMRMELKGLWKKVRMTGIFVTHDQIEALSLADRVAIMNGGRIEQCGTPRQVYQNPATRFVRDFLGRVVNLHGTVHSCDTGPCVDLGGAPSDGALGEAAGKASGEAGGKAANGPAGATPGTAAHASGGAAPARLLLAAGAWNGLRPGDRAQVSIRPEHVEVLARPAEAGEPNVVHGVIEELLFTGHCYETRIRASGGSVLLELPSSGNWKEGQALALHFREDALTLWPEPSR